jgi:protein dithiol:quinone oxidoreductase
MNHYPAVQWPWIGFLILLALLAQELVLKIAPGPNDLSLTAWRIATMTLGVASLGLLIMPRWRLAHLLGALVCAGLIGYALYMQHGLGLEPCPLCILQRVAVIAAGVVFLLAAFHDPGRVGAIVYSCILIVIAVAGAAVAARHVWLQGLPPAEVPACGPGLSYMLETLPFSDVLASVFKGSGDCASVDWRFLGLSIPGWTLVFFLSLIVAAIELMRRD